MAAAPSLPRLDDTGNACLFFAAADTSEMQHINPRAAVLRNTDSLAMTVRESAGALRAAVDLQTANEEAALNLSKIVDGMIGLALLNAEGNPVAAELAQRAEVRLEGRRLRISLDADVDDLIGCAEESREPEPEEVQDDAD